MNRGFPTGKKQVRMGKLRVGTGIDGAGNFTDADLI